MTVLNLSEGDTQVVNASEAARKRVSVGAGSVSINDDYASSEVYEPAKVGSSVVVSRAVAIRGPGRVVVTELNPAPAFGQAPDQEAPKKAEPKPKPTKKGKK